MISPSVAIPRNPAQFLTSLNAIVMQPGLYPYPQVLAPRGIVFGKKPRDLRTVRPLIDGSSPGVVKDEKEKKLRAKIEGVDVIEDISSLDDALHYSFLGPVHAIEGVLDKTPEALLVSTNISFFRDGFDQRMQKFRGRTIRSMVSGAPEERGPSRNDLYDFAVDFALAAELSAGRSAMAGEFCFLSGVLFGALSQWENTPSRYSNAAQTALRMFTDSMRGFSSWPAPVLGELVLSRTESADERLKIGRNVSDGWLQASRRFGSVDEVRDICLLRGLVIAVGAGAWQEADKLFQEKARMSLSVKTRELDRRRSIWAYAMGRPWETDSKRAWDNIASRINDVLQPYDTRTASFRGVPQELEGLKALLSAATDFRLGRGNIQ